MDFYELSFKIGAEFNLETGPKHRIKEYDGYVYLGEIIVLSIKPLHIELIFGLDILADVILSFKESDILKEHGHTQINQYFYISNPLIYYSFIPFPTML